MYRGSGPYNVTFKGSWMSLVRCGALLNRSTVRPIHLANYHRVTSPVVLRRFVFTCLLSAETASCRDSLERCWGQQQKHNCENTRGSYTRKLNLQATKGSWYTPYAFLHITFVAYEVEF